ncbi:MAG TPA: TIGR04086 family membrane protein [Lachnospiraceae bacterium]|nr:TIGR04086 family membrane protein [Lachnospiraceae bacterium]
MDKRAEKRMEDGVPILFLLKCLLFSYILTGGMLMLLALLVYRFSLSEKIVSVAIIAIYIGATFFAGFVTGKKLMSKKFLWGLVMGSMYFFVLVILSIAINHSFKDVASNFFTVMVMCAGSGMLGGMLS